MQKINKTFYMKIKNLNNYVLFVFNDEQNNRITSTSDVEILKKYSPSETFTTGQNINIFEEDMVINDIKI